jgi:predicted dehydrogenase
MKAFRIAIIGGGGISKAHIAAAKTSGGLIEVVASADPLEPARQALESATGAPAFQSFQQLLESPAGKLVDGLVVCTPPSVRLPIVETALARGMAVLVEKPLAHTLEDAKSLAEMAARHAGVVSGVAYCHRYVPAVQEMKRLLSSGELGELVRFENTFACSIPSMKDKWMSDPALSGGGSFIDTGCHSLDLYQNLVGTGAVAGAVFRKAWQGRGESAATVLMQSEHSMGVIQSGWLEPARFTLGLVGTKAGVFYDYDAPEVLRIQPVEGSARNVPVESHEVRFDRQLTEFAELARGQRQKRLLATFDQGLQVARWVDAAQRTAKII